MNTFNLGLVFGKAEIVVIFVCASEKPLNENQLNFVATQYFKYACSHCQTVQEAVQEVANGIKASCGCEVVVVPADATCWIPRNTESP